MEAGRGRLASGRRKPRAFKRTALLTTHCNAGTGERVVRAETTTIKRDAKRADGDGRGGKIVSRPRSIHRVRAAEVRANGTTSECTRFLLSFPLFSDGLFFFHLLRGAFPGVAQTTARSVGGGESRPRSEIRRKTEFFSLNSFQTGPERANRSSRNDGRLECMEHARYLTATRAPSPLLSISSVVRTVECTRLRSYLVLDCSG